MLWIYYFVIHLPGFFNLLLLIDIGSFLVIALFLALLVLLLVTIFVCFSPFAFSMPFTVSEKKKAWKKLCCSHQSNESSFAN